MDIKQYINEQIGKDFSQKIKELKNKIGSEKFDPNNSGFGIAGNTFRAFRGYKKPPSKVYRRWASRTTESILKNEELYKYTSQNEFDEWHDGLFDDLQEHWKAIQGKSVSLAHTYKMIDLFLKWLLSNEKCPKILSETILAFGYCALDSQILFILNKSLSCILPIRKPSMGDIQNKNTYDYCQYLIKEFSEYHGGTRILFDYYAWQPGGANWVGR